jgi:ABC-2 type transport system permease protein
LNPRIIITDFTASVRSWSRSTGTVFWTIAFPVILILIFGAIFSGSDDATYQLHVQDLDDSTWSNTYTDVLKSISILNITMVDEEQNITDYIEDEDLLGALVIPDGFGESIQQSFMDSNMSINVSFYYDPSESQASVLGSIISSSIQQFNMELTGGHNVIGMSQKKTLTEDFDFIDFFVPGMIGFTVMQTCIYGSIERNTKYRKDGILRKLLTTPVTRSEWILSKMMFMLFLSFISSSIIIIVGVLVWGLNIHITPLMIILIIANSFLFSGLGMIIGRFVKEEETADMAGGAITFPMMFLAGTFFPLEMMPTFLQQFAKILPLYYVNEGLRNAMIYMNFDKALFHTSVVLIFAIVFFIAGVLLTKWKED